MDVKTAGIIIGLQDRNLKRIRDWRMECGGYEFRLNYQGGFSGYIAIDYRQKGKRNFKFFGGFGGYKCATIKDAVNECKNYIAKRMEV